MTIHTQTTGWLQTNLQQLPAEVRMIYVEKGESMTPAPDSRLVARFDLFGFHAIPEGGFDPHNEDHVADLGEWDWEASEPCRFEDVPLDSQDWLQVLRTAVQNELITQLLSQRKLLLLFADHDGSVSVVRV